MEKQGQEIVNEAEKLGVSTDGIFEAEKYPRYGALQQRVRNAKDLLYARRMWIVAVISALTAIVGTVIALVAVLRNP